MAEHPLDDVELMLGVQNGDVESFDCIVAIYQPRLTGFFRRVVGVAAPVEDLCQDVFFSLHRSRATYRPTAPLSSWIFRIASNIATSHLRALARRDEVSLGEISPSLPDRKSSTPEEMIDRLEEHEAVRAAIMTLSPKERAAMVMSKYEGMSYGQIGFALESSVAAIRSLLSRARARLRDVLVRYLNSGKMP